MIYFLIEQYLTLRSNILAFFICGLHAHFEVDCDFMFNTLIFHGLVGSNS